MTAGYSGTPLAKKLGIKEGFDLRAVNPPADYQELLAPLPAGVTFHENASAGLDLAHLFTNSKDELARSLPELRRMIKEDGAIWVSWYKRAAKLPTEITEENIREAAFPLGVVDVKVCAVDDKWSGLKLVIRKAHRSR